MPTNVRSYPESGHSRVRLACPLSADFVAKVGGPLQVRNFRIQWARRLNQSCAAGLFFESMLRVGMRKIFLQQYRPTADIRERVSRAMPRRLGLISVSRAVA